MEFIHVFCDKHSLLMTRTQMNLGPYGPLVVYGGCSYSVALSILCRWQRRCRTPDMTLQSKVKFKHILYFYIHKKANYVCISFSLSMKGAGQ